jgi:hypothetical protein
MYYKYVAFSNTLTHNSLSGFILKPEPQEMIMKLTYWIAENEEEPCYSVIGKTKRAVIEQIESRRSLGDYSPIEKKVIIYKDAFDLLDMLTGEMGGRGFFNAN